MSTVTLAEVPSPIEQSSRPWKPMARVTWLQHRVMIFGVLGLVSCLALYMFVMGPQIHTMYAKYVVNGCPFNFANAANCSGLQSQLGHSAITITFIDIALHVIPVVVAMFVGAPLIAREFETGTYRFTWTQGMSRTTWLTLKLTFLALIVTVSTTLLGLLAQSYAGPYSALGLGSPWVSGQFDITALLLPAWVLFGLTLGTFIGALLKRAVSAMAVTGAVAGGILIAVFWKIDHLLLSVDPRVMKASPVGLNWGTLNSAAAPVSVGRPLHAPPLGSWLVNGWYTGADGRHLTTPAIKTLLQSMYSGKLLNHPMTWLAQHRDSFWVSYQPASRFWMFESVEAAVLVGIAVVLVRGTLLLIRRHA